MGRKVRLSGRILFLRRKNLHPKRATSRFIRESDIGVYDSGYAEGDYCHDRNVELAILNFSYAESFSSLAIAPMSRIVGVNSICAIYDVDASGLKSDTDKLVFVGVFMYSK